MKNCDFKKNDILAYCYQELNPQKMREIQEHLKFCGQCSSQAQKFQKILNLVTTQKLKEIPEGLLDNYIQEIRHELSPKTAIVSLLKERIYNVLDNLSFIFSPKLIPVTITLGLAIFVFVTLQQGKIGSVDSINQDIALLEQIDKETQGVFLLEDDEEGLFEAMQNVDAIVLAQLEEEINTEDIFYDLELLQELDEDLNDGSLTEDLELLDEIEMETASS